MPWEMYYLLLFVSFCDVSVFNETTVCICDLFLKPYIFNREEMGLRLRAKDKVEKSESIKTWANTLLVLFCSWDLLAIRATSNNSSHIL